MLQQEELAFLKDIFATRQSPFTIWELRKAVAANKNRAVASSKAIGPVVTYRLVNMGSFAGHSILARSHQPSQLRPDPTGRLQVEAKPQACRLGLRLSWRPREHLLGLTWVVEAVATYHPLSSSTAIDSADVEPAGCHSTALSSTLAACVTPSIDKYR